MKRIATGLAAASVGMWLGGGVACVDTGHRATTGASCVVPAPVPYTGNAVIPSTDTSPAGPYAWKNVAINGGGFVSGIVLSPVMPGLAFARTDVGGAYRFDPTNGRWWPLTDWVGHATSNLIGIESIAADPVDPNRVYIAAGEYLTAGNGSILSSTDMGQTWTVNSIPAPMGGNVDGRSMGERLAIDPNLTSTLYFGSRNAGLWQSADNGQTWSLVSSFPTTGITGSGAGSGGSGTGYGLTFVLFDPKSGTPGAATRTIYVGVGTTTDVALYQSTDAGATWAAVPGQPPVGMMPHHAVLDRCGNMFLAYNNGSGPNGITAGAVWRYAMESGVWADVSPPKGPGGFGGIAADATNPGTLLVTTLDRWSPDEIYRTTNGGSTWTAIGSRASRDAAGANWLYWHGSSPTATGWMGDVEIDPFDPAHALHITGQGLWSSSDVTKADNGDATDWTFEDSGLEETVVLDLASPPTGAPLLSGVGDIGGFRHDNLDVSPPDGMFGDPIFSNTNSLDFAESAPNVVARVGTSQSSDGQNGAASTDGGTTWTAFATSPPVMTTTGSTPVVPSAGSVAVSADGATILWVPQRGTSSSTPLPAFTRDGGATWTASAGIAAGMLIAADRVNPSKLYASGRGAMYVSTDGGATFVQATIMTSQGMTPASGRPRPVFGIEGEIWAATSSGLIHSQDSGMTYTPLAGVTGATAVGFGAPVASGATYPAIYLAGAVVVSGLSVWGTYRSDDAGTTWQRIDDPQHQFGYLNCLAGDRRQPGRVYLGTSGRGIIYGDPH